MPTPLTAFALVAAVLAAPVSAPLFGQASPDTRTLTGVAPFPALQVSHADAVATGHLAWATWTGGTAPSAPQEVQRNRRKGALWGGGIGLVAGGLLGGLTAGSQDDDGLGTSLVESAATGEAVVLGALFGAGLGALLGATVFAPSRPVPSGAGSGVAVLVGPRPEGAGAGVRIGLRWRR